MSDNESIDKIATSLRKKIGNIEINAENIMTILKFAMEIVETTELKGEDQKALCIKLLRDVIVEAPIADENEKFLLDMIDNGMVGNTIDLIIEATKGEININKVEKIGTSCCLAFLKK